MSFSFEPQNPAQPMNVGNVVSAGIHLYTNRFRQYFMVALKATLWLLLPIVLLGIFAGIFAVSENKAILGLLIPVGLVSLVYGIGQYLVGSATIARLAFAELNNQPETTKQATRFTQARLWGFWLVGVLVSLLYIALTLGCIIILFVLFYALLAVAGGLATSFTQLEAFFSNNVGFILLAILLTLGLILGVSVLLTWMGARFAIVELPLAIEPNTTAVQSIRRSWSLTQGSGWRIVMILLITFLITIPIYGVLQVLTTILQGISGFLMSSDTNSNASILGILLLVVSYIASLAINVLLLPLWQAIKAVIYYDLRSRREGMGLALRDREP
jgi:hypothetical protein